MAWVTRFDVKQGGGTIHPTQVVGQVKVFAPDGATPIIQIDMFGSDERSMPGKQSQTLQLGREAAEQLLTILKTTYGL